MGKIKYLTRTIWLLSLVSLFTDFASEMLYPVMPVYLKSIGFSIVLIGILEGIAEATAGLSKGYFGNLSDVSGKRMPFVRLGYLLSAISKPMMAVFIYPLWIFFARTIDRFGKGIRTGARDALLSDESDSVNKGKVFGFHRALDTFGAVLGPAVALIYLWFYPNQYKVLFIIAFIPGVIAVLLTFLIKEKSVSIQKDKIRKSSFSFFKFPTHSTAEYKKIIAGLLLFSLFNSSDVFLLLKVKQSGFSDTMVIGLYIFYNLIYSLSAFPAGILADKIGLKKILTVGLILFAVVYFGMGLTTNKIVIIAMFFLYGLYAAFTEGISKALISNSTDKKYVATAIGTYSGYQSLCLMLASFFTGIMWYKFGAGVSLIVTGVVALIVAAYFMIINLPLKNGSVNQQ